MTNLDSMVAVQLKLGELRKQIEVPAGCTAAELATLLPDKWRQSHIVVINGKLSGPGSTLQIGDRVVLLPKLAGG
jgi:molybdopterin converting factor small subunit